jgi:hypothetical protein
LVDAGVKRSAGRPSKYGEEALNTIQSMSESGMSVRDIAAAVKIPKSTVHSLLKRVA